MSASAQAVWGALGMLVAVETTDAQALRRARRIAEGELAAADAAYSPVRDDTELAGVHAARGAPAPAGPRLLEAVAAALRAARATHGLVDPALGARLVAAGGPRGLRVERRPAWRDVECDRAAATLRVPAGVRLDLGATGKALIADRSARRIAAGGAGVLVSVGGDVATAGPPPSGGWLVRVTDDHRARGGGETIRLSTGALATSSTAVRGAHIVDPRRRRAAAGPWRTVSVAAATCVDANAASTAAIVLGDAAPAWLTAAGLPALLIARDGGAVRVAGWPEPGGA